MGTNRSLEWSALGGIRSQDLGFEAGRQAAGGGHLGAPVRAWNGLHWQAAGVSDPRREQL